MIKNNVTSNCPNYEQIMALFPDGTNQKMSGEFKLIDNMLQRGHPQTLNPLRLYDFESEPVIWIDPPGNVRDRIRMITISASLPEYKDGEASLNMDNYTISFQKDRWINPNCTDAIITSENWIFLTGDTMNYLKHGCDPAFTSFDGTVKKQFEKSYQSLITTSKWKLDEMYKLARENYKTSHIGSNEEGFNRAIIEDEDE